MPAIARAECADLIEKIRSLVGEAKNDVCDAISDADVQSELDETRERVRYAEMEAEWDFLPGGQIVYKRFEGEKWMDANTQVLSQNYTPLVMGESDAWDPLHGVWLFANTQSAVLLLVGNRYDVYEAASNLLRKIQADNKYSVDTADANLKTFDSQALTTMARLEAAYRRQVRVRSFEFSRSDV